MDAPIERIDRLNAAEILEYLGMDPRRGAEIRNGQADDDWLVKRLAYVRCCGFCDGAERMKESASSIAAGKILAHGISWEIMKLAVPRPRKA